MTQCPQHRLLWSRVSALPPFRRMCWVAGTQPSTWRKENPVASLLAISAPAENECFGRFLSFLLSSGSLKLLPLKHSPAWPALPRARIVEDTEGGSSRPSLCTPSATPVRGRPRSYHQQVCSILPGPDTPQELGRWTGMCPYSPALREAAAWWRRWTMEHK